MVSEAVGDVIALALLVAVFVLCAVGGGIVFVYLLNQAQGIKRQWKNRGSKK